MNYYLVECEYPTVKLRHYKNSRVAAYTLEQVNSAAGYNKFMVISDDEPVITMSVKRQFVVDPYAPGDQVIERVS